MSGAIPIFILLARVAPGLVAGGVVGLSSMVSTPEQWTEEMAKRTRIGTNIEPAWSAFKENWTDVVLCIKNSFQKTKKIEDALNNHSYDHLGRDVFTSWRDEVGGHALIADTTIGHFAELLNMFRDDILKPYGDDIEHAFKKEDQVICRGKWEKVLKQLAEMERVVADRVKQCMELYEKAREEDSDPSDPFSWND